MGQAPRALRAFFGSSERANPLERPQDIFTPAELLQPLLSVWGRIALDPCGNKRSPVRAQRRIFGRRRRDNTKRGWHWTGRGLLEEWADRSYANPPFERIDLWALKAQQEGQRYRVALLSPLRTQRPWLRRAMKSCAVFALNPVCFEGYNEQFPAALGLLYWGSDARKVFRAFERAELGEPLWYRWNL